MKSILIVLIALLACLVVLASCEHTIKTKHTSKDSLILESTNKNEDTIEFMFKNSESFPLIGVKLVRQAPVSSSNSSNQQSSSSGSHSQQQSGSQSSSQTVQPQSSTPPSQQQEQVNGSVITGSQQQQQQQSNSSSQAASQQSSQSSNQTQTVEKQDNPQAQSSSQAGSQGTSSSSQAATPQSGQNQNSTASSSSTSQSSQQGSSSTSQSTAQTNPVTSDNSSISGDTHMDLTPNTTQSSGQGQNVSQPSEQGQNTSQSSGQGQNASQPSDNSTVTSTNTTLVNETLQNIGISNSTKDINITDIIGRIISGENITEIINNTLGNLTQWLNSTLDNINQNISQSQQQQQQQSRSLHRRLLSLLESNEENEDFAQYLKFNKLKLMSSEGETLKEIPLSDSNIHWNYGHSVVHNNEQAFKVPHVDVEIPLSTASNRPTLKIRTMMTESPSHVERNGRDIQLNPRSMDIQISLNNLHDLLSEQEKKLSGTKWSIETEMSSTSNSLHLLQTKSLNGIQKVVVMGNNFTPKGQFTFSSSPHMKVIQDSVDDALISIQIQDSSNSIQLNPIKFGVH